MLTVEKSVVINQAIEKVFEFASNAENEPLWRTEINESKVTSDGPFGVGSTVSQTAHFMGRRIDATAEISEYEKNRIVAWKMTSGPFSGNGSTTYEVVNEGQTKVTIASNFDVSGFFKLAEPLVARSGRRQTEANLASLKDMLEADADSSD
jgi:uncharacterized membrane protein